MPRADVPTAPSAAGPKPSLSYRISFFPPGAGKERELVEEFVQEFESSRFFEMIAPAPAESDIRTTIVLTQSCAMTSKGLVLYLATGTLLPVRVPCEYRLQAEILYGAGSKVDYEIRDEASKLVWAPGWPPGVDWGIDPSSSAVRRNLYRTLMVKMHADGLLGQRARSPGNDDEGGRTAGDGPASDPTGGVSAPTTRAREAGALRFPIPLPRRIVGM